MNQQYVVVITDVGFGDDTSSIDSIIGFETKADADIFVSEFDKTGYYAEVFELQKSFHP